MSHSGVPLVAVCQAHLKDPVLVAGREEEHQHQAEDVDISHPDDPGLEGPVVLQGLSEILIPLATWPMMNSMMVRAASGALVPEGAIFII